MGSVVRLQSVLKKFTIYPKHNVTTKGEVGSAMYIVVSGWLEMDTQCVGINSAEEGDAGTKSTVTSWASYAGEGGKVKIGPGQSFGEEVLLGFVECYEYTVTVVEKAKLHMILESEFNDLFTTMPNEIERMRANALELNP